MDALHVSTDPASIHRDELLADAAASRAFLLDGLGVSNRGARSVRNRSTDEVAVDLPCRTHDPELWFAEKPADIDRAKALCAACPIRLACLAVAVHRAEHAGVWGGHIFDQGRIVPRKRGRGRPRKHRRGPVATPTSDASPQEQPRVTSIAPKLRQTSADGMDSAAARLYEAECALHAAHQSRVDTWTNAASRRLHEAVSEYLIEAGARTSPEHRQRDEDDADFGPPHIIKMG